MTSPEAAALGAVCAVTAGNIAFPPKPFGGTAVFLLSVNFAGARLIFRPADRYLSGGDRADYLERRGGSTGAAPTEHHR